jgi:hypothetical protein
METEKATARPSSPPIRALLRFVNEQLLTGAEPTIAIVLLNVLLKNPPLAWVWVGLIYQVRLSMKSKMKPKIPSSTAVVA